MKANNILTAFRNHRRAVAAVEFALIVPFLAIVLAVATDYGFKEWSRSCLINAVAQGAYYAFLTGPNVSVAAVQTLVQDATSLTGVAVNKRPSPVVGCYCPSGTPATIGTTPLSTTFPCTTPCNDGTGTTAAPYLVITATYTPIAIIPYYSGLSGSISETATVRLQ